MNLVQKITQLVLKPKLHKSENKIGYKLFFHNIPERFVNGMVEWDLTETFHKFGINVIDGADYWTLGHIVDGMSSRFDRNAPEYQAWLGGYVVRLSPGQNWTKEEHFKLAMADQNSWLHTYGDPNPMTLIEGFEFKKLQLIEAGAHQGTLYEFGCITHSDVGNGNKPKKFKIETDIFTDLFNLSNPTLQTKGTMFRPKESGNYETLTLRGYIAIFDVDENVKVVLYGNGAIVDGKDTFEIIKNDLLIAMESCEIRKV
jgi:hypothetical protein